MEHATCGEKDCGTVSCYVRMRRQGVNCPRCKQAKALYERARRVLPPELVGAGDPERVAEDIIIQTLLLSSEGRPLKEVAEIAGVPVSRLYRMGPSPIPPVSASPKCGELRKYRGGCRCDACKEANRLHSYKYRPKKVGKRMSSILPHQDVGVAVM